MANCLVKRMSEAIWEVAVRRARSPIKPSLTKRGNTTAAKIPMIRMVNIASTRVNPVRKFIFFFALNFANGVLELLLWMHMLRHAMS